MHHDSTWPPAVVGLGPREQFIAALRVMLDRDGIARIRAEEGLGARSTALAALGQGHDVRFTTDGNWHRRGYLAGFEEALDFLRQQAEARLPELITRHEHTLKRLWPFRASSLFETPRDLTHVAQRGERTRFYHHEYQEKLLFGLSEFIGEVLRACDIRLGLIIDNAGDLSPTAKRLLEVIVRARIVGPSLCIILIERDNGISQADLAVVNLPGLDSSTLANALPLARYGSSERNLILARSSGNAALAFALIDASTNAPGLPAPLPLDALLDLRLSVMAAQERQERARDFVEHGLRGNRLNRRSYETLDESLRDHLNLAAHQRALDRYRAGQGPLTIVHALALCDPMTRAQALVAPSEILMGIGLYDSWFSYFSALFGDVRLRLAGSGDTELNEIFINAAFVLYAMGRADVALPFLEAFLIAFPLSRFVPTALYAQSMVYGRYQIPVDLDRAEECAVTNLTLIDRRFAEHPRYTYIKAFAENAYAYIKARQGHFSEALLLCERGIGDIVDTYGYDRFELHRSILIYNTSQVYELAGDLDQAEARLREAIACDPFYAEYHNDLGNLLSRVAGRDNEALASYRQAIALSPPYYEAHLNRGMLRLRMGDLTAMEDFERALAIKPAEWRAMRELGNALLLQGDPEAALRWYRAVFDYQPHDADTQANSAVAASDLGRSELAMAFARGALASNEAQTGAHTVLAFELVKSGRVGEALKHARKAALHDTDPDLLQNLAQIERIAHCSVAFQRGESNESSPGG